MCRRDMATQDIGTAAAYGWAAHNFRWHSFCKVKVAASALPFKDHLSAEMKGTSEDDQLKRKIIRGLIEADDVV